MTVLEAAGITREEMCALVARRQEEVREAEQCRVDGELLRIGREFAEERVERREPPRAPRAVVVEKPALTPLIETDGCAAYRCPNVAEVEVADEFNGRVLRVRYCLTHGEERRAELAT